MKRRRPFHSPAVWPTTPMVAIFLIIYGVFTGGIWLMQIRWGIATIGIKEAPGFKPLLTPVLVGAAVVYALYRLWRFHPACNRAYAAWLGLTPWTPQKPLPLGPVLLVWQDVVVICLLMAIAQWHARIDPAWPAVAFGLTWMIGMTILLAITRVWPALLLLGFLWPTLMLPETSGWPGIVLLAAMVLVIWWGYLQSLQTFPWRTFNQSNLLLTAEVERTGLNREIRLDMPGMGTVSLGWPYLILSPKFKTWSILKLTGFWISSLAGWWAYCIIKNSAMDPAPGLLLFFAVAAAFVRLIIYNSHVAPPFNVWGRIASGHFILPGFDKVFVTPLSVVLLGIAGEMICERSGSWYPLTESGAFALICFIVLTGGPTLQKWILTGQLRFRPAPGNKTRQRLRRV